MLRLQPVKILIILLSLLTFYMEDAFAQNKVVVIPLFETVKEPIEPYFPLPDTGQTTSHTTTFGEDSDYTRNPPSYTDNGDGTVTDNVTGLVWQKTDDNTTRNWDDAWTYCQALSLGGETDWHLPGANELMSIVYYGTINPAIDSFAFSGTNATLYWSATTYASSSGSAWGVNFYSGGVDGHSKSDPHYVRCVR